MTRTAHSIKRRLYRSWRWLRARLSKMRRRRSLIGEILAFQLMFAAVIGMLALTVLWWASTWVIQDNMRKWGEQWLANLDELGMPLYVSDDREKYLRIEEYVAKFNEISFVRYYSESGAIIFAESPQETALEIPALTSDELGGLTAIDMGGERYVLDTLLDDTPLVRIAKPIWTESMLSDGLLGFDPDAMAAVEKTLVGFVELGLDFSNYQTQLTKSITTGALIGVALILLLTAASWLIYRRALLPLSQLQKPLRELARGKTARHVSTSGHKEIVAIADALNTTVTALRERDKRLWQLANHDRLTGLVNRYRFAELLEKELEIAGRTGRTSALLFIDLDQFKYVNDMFGHAAGDRLLAQVASRLRTVVRKEDLVSRFGGDEFTVLISDVSKRDVSRVCAELIRLRETRFEYGGEAFNIRCSIGVTMIRGDEVGTTDLLAQADLACHQAKTRGRNQFQFYKASSKEKNAMAADIGWSQQIQAALEQDNFVLHFQPIVDVESGRASYYEVLLRMRVGNRKLIPPSAFLPAAHRFGLMAEIDRWVIKSAIRQLAEFREKDRNVRFTLNVSGSIFETTDPFKIIEKNLEQYGVPLDAIVLEITEQVAVLNMGNAARQITYLAEQGCKFAIDDFGAGHSSYKYLKHLPVHFVKIDGSFVTNLVEDVIDQKIVASICEIAEATNSKTIAEHVGDYRTLELLRKLGVDYAQGYYLGRPSAKLKANTMPVSIDSARYRRYRGA